MLPVAIALFVLAAAVFCAPPADASTQAAPRLELLRRRGSMEQFGIVCRLHAFEITWRKRRGKAKDAGIRGFACGGGGHVDRLRA